MERLRVPGAVITYRNRQAAKPIDAELPAPRHATYNDDLARDLKALRSVGTRSRNEELYPRVLAGDESAIKEMIEANTALAIRRASRFLTMNPSWSYYADDIQAAAILGLSKAVRCLARSDRHKSTRSPNINIVGYLSTAISGTIHDVTTTLVGKQLPTNKSVDGSVDISSSTFGEGMETLEEIEACASDGIDRIIIQRALDGYDAKQIAAEVGLKRNDIYRRRRDIHTRYTKRKKR